MKMKKNMDHLLLSKIIYTAQMILLYIIGRSIPLYGIDASKYLKDSFNSSDLLRSTISGDLNQCSLLALGIFPYMMASMGQSIYMSFRSTKSKAGISPVKSNRIVVTIMLVLAIYQAITRVLQLSFTPSNDYLIPKIIAVLQLVVGAFLILILSERNTKYGIGGQSALIFVNILDGFRTTLFQCKADHIFMIVIIVAVPILVTLFMENTQKRIPLQRVSVQNIYGDTNYQALKFNPIGIMPVMFASGVMMLPQLIVATCLNLWPDNAYLKWWNANLSLDTVTGIIIYLIILFSLTISFSVIFLNPRDITENLLQSGDSFVGIAPGKPTRSYLRKNIFILALISSLIMGSVIAIPRFMYIGGMIDSTLSMLPSSVMLVVGMWCSIYQEIQAVGKLDKYTY